ncbi:DMT family transporter [Ferrovibrio sp.]|uniref:DMT family transporter n=1 Tax=Ferrovibrio sp. TaxID=1917215 RepID=UPI00261D6945|nr:DMT family transporter [Ferrovibrio sp.]
MSADSCLADPAAQTLAKPARAEPTRLFGAAAALFTVMLWAAGLVATRFGVTGTLSLWDVVFLRLALPALILLPVLLRHPPRRPSSAAEQPRYPLVLAVLVAGSGLPFLLTSSGGMVFAPAAHAGALMPGSMPLFAALLAVLLLGERFTPSRRLGILLMLLGAIAVGGWQILHDTGNTWRGDLMFVAAGAMWACYTIAMKKSGLGVWQAAAVVYVASFLAYAPVYLLLDSRLLVAPLFEVGVQVFQSVASGLLSMAAYGFAVRRLGAASAAAFGALTPALTALLAIPLLGEWPELATWAGIVAVSLGVALANGAVSGYARSNQQKG